EERIVAIGPRWLREAGFRGDQADPFRVRVFKEGREIPSLDLGDGRVAFLATPSDSEYSREAVFWIDASGSAPPARLEPPASGGAAESDWLRFEQARQEFTIDRDEEF